VIPWLRCVLAAVIGGWLCMAPAAAEVPEARVLILNALDPYLPAYQAIDSAMRAQLAEQTDRRIVLYSELLDAQRFGAESLEPELIALLAKKYRALRVDVVVTVTRPAFEFYKRHGERLWPGARLVAHGLPDPASETVALPPGALAQVNRDDVEGTLALARRLQPQAQRVLVVSGSSPLDQELERRARQVLQAAVPAPEVEVLSGWPLPELVARMAQVPSDTIVLFLSQFRDRDNRPYLPRAVLRAISDVSAAPVYGLFETYVGQGVAAGHMEVYADRGRLVAQLIRRALSEAPPAGAASVFTVPSRCVADARELRRWSLDEARLPAGCDLRFVERPAWRQYLWQIALGLLILMVQSVLIVALVLQRRRRRLAEEESQTRLSEVVHMNRRVAMGELAASIAHELNQPLGAIYNNAGAAQVLIRREPPDLKEVADILDDIKQDDKRASEVLSRLRSMLRKAPANVEELALDEVIDGVLSLLRAEAASQGVSLKAEFEPGLPRIRADAVQLQQVILNLALNGIEAMRSQPEGQRQLTIRGRRVNAGEVEVVVSDSGNGFDAKLLPRAFDAFVSSKPDGMGLGLSISRTIVEAHGGRMAAENASEGGAAVRFTLPLSQAGAA
jgi:signal transduction histidine kinase